ncbi:hypothetical protein Cni_G08458 [Canna indica]|uniref:RING-type domain-containing protein n=1 Tax=Canna indica TaxID=4628 RepID=A0AAQ3K489_9LILI|nr:hypothetical protein Cni_G08458 [Canna indica]
MASSVARMPAADEWRNPGRLPRSVFGAGSHGRTSFSPAQRRKVLLRQHSDVPSASYCSPYRSRSSSQAANEDGGSPTGKRQPHEVDNAVLTTTSQLISARAKSLLREMSPAKSESSIGSASASSSSPDDVRCSVRASSLIQMWRELESEAGLTTKHRPSSSGGNADNSNAASFSADEHSCANSDAFDQSEAFGDWNSDMTTTTSCEPAHCPSLLSKNEKGRVENIVQKLSSVSRTRTIASSLNYKSQSSRRENSSSSKSLRQENPAMKDKKESSCSMGTSGLSRCRLRKRRDLKDFVASKEQERQRELMGLVERQFVSGFAHRGQLQSMLRLRSLRRQTDQDQLRTHLRTMESNQLRSGISISFLRERFNQMAYDSDNRKKIQQSTSSVQVQFPIDADSLSYAYCNDQLTSDNNQWQETMSLTDSETSPVDTNTPHSRNDDLVEENHSADVFWDDRNLRLSDLDRQRRADSLPSNGWQGEVVVEEIESHSPQNVINWIDEPSYSCRPWKVSRRPMCHDFFRKFAENVEIMDLFERKRVSTSLESDFCDKMNQVILSFLHRRGKQIFDDDIAENHEDHLFWQQNDEYQNTKQDAPVASPLVPLQYQTLHHAENWCHTSYTHQPSQKDMDAMHELRSDIANIREDISELRKLVESCVEWQTKLRHFVKQDILDAMRQSTGTTSTLHTSQAASAKKDRCSICCERQVDSLFYRCGHMYACFNCAYELQWSSGKCPVCQSPIVDVVRAFSNL